MKKYWLISLILFSQFCTFGSEGNSLTDKKIIITRLALLKDSIKTNANLQILFYDDQGDNNLESFQQFSGNNTDIYTITLNDSSIITFNKIEFYISSLSNNRLEETESNSYNIFLHESDSGGTISPSGTIKVFTTANGYSTSSFIKFNALDEFGAYSGSDTFNLAELPQGSLQKLILHFSSIVFAGVLKGPNKTKTFTIQLPASDISFTRLCTTTLGLNQDLSLKIDIKYSDLFKDSTPSSYTTIDNTKILRSINDLTDNNPTISNTQNSGIYNEIIKNWNLTSTLKEHRCSK